MTVEQRTPVGARESETGRPITLTTRQLVLSVSVLLIAAQAAFRGWGLLGSWFYLDDYRLLYQAQQSGWGPDYLALPFDSQLMPLGRLLVKVVAESGHLDWVMAAALTLGLQVLASAACAWMLLTMFGARWGVVGILSLYLCFALTVPALMWWAAALNQVPLQVVAFAAIGTWTNYLRTRRNGWLVLTLLLLGLGLLAYVKTLLLVPVLVFLLLAFFTRGRALSRLRQTLRERWLAVAAGGGLVLAYLGYYLTHVPSISATPSASVAADLARTMLGTSLPTTLVGGPWSWDTSNPPVALADPPRWTVAAAWVLLMLLVVGVAVLRRRTLRAWVLLVGYALGVYLLALSTRAAVVGPDVGRELRYLTDVAPVAILCLGLATMSLHGAVQSSEPRPGRTSGPWLGRATTVLVACACIGGILSSAVYIHVWHVDNPGERWVRNARAGLAKQESVPVADSVVPDDVIANFQYPWNTLRRLLPVVTDNVTFPSVTERLATFDTTGELRQAVIDPATTSPPGPRPDCGWRLERGRSRTIPLRAEAFDYTWWVRVGYLASEDAAALVTAGDTTTPVRIQRGLHSLFLEVDTALDEVTISGLPTSTAVCVDVVEVGRVAPGGPL